MLKRPVAAGDLVGFPFAGLAFLDGNTANVLWAMALTLAVLVLLVQALFGGLQLGEYA